MDKFSRTFAASARRRELVVYPCMPVRLNKMNTIMEVVANPVYPIRNDRGRMSNNMQQLAGPMAILLRQYQVCT